MGENLNKILVMGPEWELNVRHHGNGNEVMGIEGNRNVKAISAHL